MMVRSLLDQLEAKQRAAAEAVASSAVGAAAPSPDPDTDELREKFRIMKVGWQAGRRAVC